MGSANCVWKTGSVPSLPGKTKSSRLHSSVSRFWIGEPVMMMRCTYSMQMPHQSRHARQDFQYILLPQGRTAAEVPQSAVSNGFPTGKHFRGV